MPPLLSPDLAVVTGLALDQLDPLKGLPAAELLAALGDLVPNLVDDWTLAGASVGADYYDAARELAGAKGSFRAIVDPSDMGARALLGWVSEPLRQLAPDTVSALSRLEGGLQKRIVNAANEVVTTSAAADPAALGWVRHTRAGACPFCLMAAGRGAVFSKSTARFACHEHCHCSASVAFDGAEKLRVHDYRQSFRTANMSPEQRAAHNAAAKRWIKDNMGEPAPAEVAAKAVEVVEPSAAVVAAAKVDNPPIESSFDRWLRADDAARGVAKRARTLDDDLDELLGKANRLVESGDFDAADKAFADAEKLEKRIKAKAAKEAAAEAVDAEKRARVIDLIDNQGWNYVEAEAEVYDVAPEHIYRRDFMAKARSEGHAGKSFDELVASMHSTMAAEQYWAAEEATNGFMLKRKYEGKFDPARLWSVNDATARKVMSDEMAAWFDEHGGRMTRSMFRQSILDGSNVVDFSRQADFLQ